MFKKTRTVLLSGIGPKATAALTTASLLIGVLALAAPLPTEQAAPGQASFSRALKSNQDCTRVCSEIRGRLKASSKEVVAEYELWQHRLSVKTDIVRFPQGYSAAEELLKFMSGYYVTRAPENQMQPQFLAYEMGKCFPEAYIDTDRARLSGLVNTIWVAKNLKIADAISTCH